MIHFLLPFRYNGQHSAIGELPKETMRHGSGFRYDVAYPTSHVLPPNGVWVMYFKDKEQLAGKYGNGTPCWYENGRIYWSRNCVGNLVTWDAKNYEYLVAPSRLIDRPRPKWIDDTTLY